MLWVQFIETENFYDVPQCMLFYRVTLLPLIFYSVVRIDFKVADSINPAELITVPTRKAN